MMLELPHFCTNFCFYQQNQASNYLGVAEWYYSSSTKSIFNQLTSLVWSALQIKNWMKKSQNAGLGKQNGFGPTFWHSLFTEAAF